MSRSSTPGRTSGGLWPVVLGTASVLLLVLAVGVSIAPADQDGAVQGLDLGDPVVEVVPATPTPVPTPPQGTERPRWDARSAEPAAGRASATTPRPRRLVVPRLGVDMPVTPTGVTRTGAMALPERPSTVGWYRYGPRPGEASGSAVLAGHVDSSEFGIGPLAEFRRLREGDRIVVERSGGAQTYRVRKVVLISKRSIPLEDVFERSGPANLRIVTCGGPYDPSRGGYRDNLVVTAVPL